MDSAHPVIIKVSIPEYQHVIVDTSNGRRYFSDLSALSKVYCFPRTKAAWKQVSPDDYGLGLIWVSRFEVHLDHIIGLAYKVERSRKSA